MAAVLPLDDHRINEPGVGLEPTTTGLTDQKKLLLASCTSRVYYALYPTELPWHIRAEGRTRTSDTQFPYLKLLCVSYTRHIFFTVALPTELLPRVSIMSYHRLPIKLTGL